MNNLCECDYGDAEMPQLWRAKNVKARKPHRCSECGARIEPGQTYQLVDAMFDGDFEHFHFCEGCAAIREVFTCPPIGGLKEAIWSELEETGDIPLVDLPKVGALKLQNFIDEWETARQATKDVPA